MKTEKEISPLTTAIRERAYKAYSHALNVIKGAWPEGEIDIALDPSFSYLYARDVLKDRFPKGEKIIAKDPEMAYLYAKDVIKGRWPKGEKAILKHPFFAYSYAREVIKGRFPEGEETIKRSKYYAPLYENFLKEIGEKNLKGRQNNSIENKNLMKSKKQDFKVGEKVRILYISGYPDLTGTITYISQTPEGKKIYGLDSHLGRVIAFEDAVRKLENNPNSKIREEIIEEILQKATENEKFGFRFGLFPFWIQRYKLSNEEFAELVRRAERNNPIKERRKMESKYKSITLAKLVEEIGFEEAFAKTYSDPYKYVLLKKTQFALNQVKAKLDVISEIVEKVKRELETKKLPHLNRLGELQLNGLDLDVAISRYMVFVECLYDNEIKENNLGNLEKDNNPILNNPNPGNPNPGNPNPGNPNLPELPKFESYGRLSDFLTMKGYVRILDDVEEMEFQRRPSGWKRKDVQENILEWWNRPLEDEPKPSVLHVRPGYFIFWHFKREIAERLKE